MNICSDNLKIKHREFNLSENFLNLNEELENSHFYLQCLQRLEQLKNLDLFDTFVSVGCGPLPTTLLFADRNYSVSRLIGIDIDPNALSVAKEVCSKVCSTPSEFHESLEEISLQKRHTMHFFVANMVSPKMDTLKTIWDMATQESVIIVREPGTPMQSNWDFISDQLNTREWKLEKKHSTCPYFKSRSIVLRKAFT